MASMRAGIALVLLTTLALTACSSAEVEPSNDPEQTETGAAKAQLAGEVTSTFPIRLAEAATALIDNHIVLVERIPASQDSPETMTLRVLDRNTGATAWTTDGRFRESVLKLRGTADTALVVSLKPTGENERLLVGLEPSSGNVMWAIPYGGGQVQVVRGTETALVATQSVPIVINTTTGEEIWRGEPGDQMQAALSTVVVTSDTKREQVLWLRNGNRVPGGLQSGQLPISRATSAGGTVWLLGRGGLAENGARLWGKGKAKSRSIVGDSNSSVIARRISGDAKMRLSVRETDTGRILGTFTPEICADGTAVGMADGVLTWACTTETSRSLMNVALI